MNGRKRPSDDESDAVNVLAGIIRESSYKKLAVTTDDQRKSESGDDQDTVDESLGATFDKDSAYVSLRKPGLSLFQRFDGFVEVANCSRVSENKPKPGHTE